MVRVQSHMKLARCFTEVAQLLVDDSALKVALRPGFRVPRQRNALLEVCERLVHLQHATMCLTPPLPCIAETRLDLDGCTEVLDRICGQLEWYQRFVRILQMRCQ